MLPLLTSWPAAEGIPHGFEGLQGVATTDSYRLPSLKTMSQGVNSIRLLATAATFFRLSCIDSLASEAYDGVSISSTHTIETIHHKQSSEK